jgi:Zn-dependent M28 family amino/carboxypeptidase
MLNPVGRSNYLCIITALIILVAGTSPGRGSENYMTELRETENHLKAHVEMLTRTIGERSIYKPENLEKTADYIESFYRDINIEPVRLPYDHPTGQVENILATINFSQAPSKTYLIGAHYDSVVNTVGADDNASAVAVQLETARQMGLLKGKKHLDLSLKFVSFALEEPPVYGTRHMGSRVYAKAARKAGEKIDGMICLEMVGYTCHEPGCQAYPFPLMFLDYPKTGDFIGIAGNIKSRKFTRSLCEAFEHNPDLPVVSLTVPLNGYLLPNIRLSDHASFWDRGYKAVMITDTAFYRNPYYHSRTDTMEKLDFIFMARLVKSLCIFFDSVK